MSQYDTVLEALSCTGFLLGSISGLSRGLGMKLRPQTCRYCASCCLKRLKMMCPAIVQVLMATNRPDTLDPALLRPGRLDRKVEFGLPDLESRTQIFQIHTRTMNCERDIRFELLSRQAGSGFLALSS